MEALRRQDSPSVVQQLESVFCERGAHAELLTDNDTAFRSRAFQEFAEEWNVKLRFCCAYVPSGNDIVERCRRTVKRIAARKGCSVQEAVYWYNLAPQDDTRPLLRLLRIKSIATRCVCAELASALARKMVLRVAPFCWRRCLGEASGCSLYDSIHPGTRVGCGFGLCG